MLCFVLLTFIAFYDFFAALRWLERKVLFFSHARHRRLLLLVSALRWASFGLFPFVL
jgi:hypothetical protein